MPTANSSADTFRPGRRLFSVVLGLSAVVAAAALGDLPARAAEPARVQDEEGFAGDSKCTLCHKELVAKFALTAHERITEVTHRCEACHGPGAEHVGTAGNKERIRDLRKVEPDVVIDTCVACHADDGIDHVTGFRTGPWAKRGLTCLDCHGIHVPATEWPEAAPAPEVAAATSTCLVCHPDPVYGAAFPHRGLEEQAPACAACHAGGEAHVEQRGAPGSIGGPGSLTPSAEASLCLDCHGGFTRAAHFADRPAGTRCTDCHTLHRARPTTAGSAGGGTDDTAGIDRPGAAPATGPGRLRTGEDWYRARVTFGGRWVDGDDGRYDEEIDLDGGFRLFDLEAEGGADEHDPDALRARIRLSGLGDPYEVASLHIGEGDAWDVTARGSRSELPFLGGGGLHPGEIERDRLSTAVDMEAGDRIRLGFGVDRLETRGDLRGTVFDGGAVVPVVGRRDRTSTEAWASFDLDAGIWRLRFRPAFLHETGDDDRIRNLSTLAGPDQLFWRDDSTMRGPKASIIADGDLLDGDLSIELRASLAHLDRSVDLTENRRGFVGVSPFTRTTRSAGDRDRDVDMVSLAASWLLTDDWALETFLERRTLRETGEVRVDQAVTTGLGTTNTTTLDDESVRQELRTASVGARWDANEALTLRAGVEHWSDDLRETGRTGETLRSLGLYARLDADITNDLSADLQARTTRTNGQFTTLTPEDRAEVGARVRWRDREHHRAHASWRRTQLEQSGMDLGSRGDSFAIGGGFGDPDGFTFDVNAAWHRLDLEIDTLAFVGGPLTAGQSRSLVRSMVLDAIVGVPVVDRLRGELSLVHVRDRGDLPVRGWDGVLGLRWTGEDDWAAGLRLRQRHYDEIGADRLDYNARVVEFFVEVGF